MQSLISDREFKIMQITQTWTSCIQIMATQIEANVDRTTHAIKIKASPDLARNVDDPHVCSYHHASHAKYCAWCKSRSCKSHGHGHHAYKSWLHRLRQTYVLEIQLDNYSLYCQLQSNAVGTPYLEDHPWSWRNGGPTTHSTLHAIPNTIHRALCRSSSWQIHIMQMQSNQNQHT